MGYREIAITFVSNSTGGSEVQGRAKLQAELFLNYSTCLYVFSLPILKGLDNGMV